MSGELERQHPLVQCAASMPWREVTAADPDLIYMLGEFRRALNEFHQSIATGTITPEASERMAKLCEDFAGVIRLTTKARQIGAPDGD